MTAATVHRLIEPPKTSKRGWLLLKRVLDLAIAIPSLVFVIPILLVAMALVRLSSPGSALFRQIRIGQNGSPFVMLKLRTMYVDANDTAFRDFNTRELLGAGLPCEHGMFKLSNDPRVVPLGRILRRYSIDELPQFVNVLRGEMSIVGPRPALPWEVEHFTPAQCRRHELPPGMTGLWQVSGRNRLSMQQMLELDMTYIEHWSPWLDLKIICRTLPAILMARTS